MEGSRMVPGRREQDGASQEAIGWCQPEGNRMVPGRLRTPGSSAPEPGACGRETAAQKDQTLQMFLSRVPVRAERKTSEVLTLEGGRISRQELTAAVLLPRAMSGGSLRDEPSASAHPDVHSALGMLVQVKPLKWDPSSLSKQQRDSPSCSSQPHPQGHSTSRALRWLDPADFPPQSPSPSSLGIQMD